MGSIPAPAGEPAFRCVDRMLHGVYPRACGGTGEPPKGHLADLGLSPRLRGNRAQLGKS